ncbi:MAG: hypothetical protein AVDCRST_MAG19-1587, partial [uncultured Thermomicrobiales bacterium]
EFRTLLWLRLHGSPLAPEARRRGPAAARAGARLDLSVGIRAADHPRRRRPNRCPAARVERLDRALHERTARAGRHGRLELPANGRLPAAAVRVRLRGRGLADPRARRGAQPGGRGRDRRCGGEGRHDPLLRGRDRRRTGDPTRRARRRRLRADLSRAPAPGRCAGLRRRRGRGRRLGRGVGDRVGPWLRGRPPRAGPRRRRDRPVRLRRRLPPLRTGVLPGGAGCRAAGPPSRTATARTLV